jgi:hypothetical protein
MLVPVDPFNQDVEVVPFNEEEDPFDTYNDRGRRPSMIEYYYRSD